MAPREQMRAADADREQYAEVVRRALDEGRLTLDEMDERLRQIYAAKTFGELEQAVADLPRATPAERSQLTVPRGAPSSPVPPSRQDPKAKLPGWLSVLWRIWLLAVLVNLVIWFLVSLTTGELIYFWPIWVAGPWGAVNIGLTILFPPRPRS